MAPHHLAAPGLPVHYQKATAKILARWAKNRDWSNDKKRRG